MRVRYSFGSRHTGKLDNIRKQRTKFPAVMKKVIEVSDIVLQVLDARFVNEMRNVEVDELVKEYNAKSIYVLNKADLVDVAEVEKTLPKEISPLVFVSVKTGQGLRELREKIMIEAKRVDLEGTPEKIMTKGKLDLEKGGKIAPRTRVQIGVVGFPNAGKSSLINRLARRGSASTSKHAGHTKGMQKIRLSKGILLLDTPGVIPESRYTTDKKSRMSLDAKLGGRTYSNVKDPEDVVSFLVTPLTPENPEDVTQEEKIAIQEAEKTAKRMSKFYKIDFENDAEVLIEELGRQKNYLKKGGNVDIDRTARIILKDWQEGKIK